MSTTSLLSWNTPEKTTYATHAVKYLVRLNREIGPIMCYITTDYKNSTSTIIAIHSENKHTPFEYKAYDRQSLVSIETTMSWTKNVNLVPSEKEPGTLYFSPLPDLRFIKKSNKLFTLQTNVMIVNIHFIVNSILTGDVQIQLMGIEEKNGNKRLVTTTIPCGYNMISVIQSSMKDTLFNLTK